MCFTFSSVKIERIITHYMGFCLGGVFCCLVGFFVFFFVLFVLRKWCLGSHQQYLKIKVDIHPVNPTSSKVIKMLLEKK